MNRALARLALFAGLAACNETAAPVPREEPDVRPPTSSYVYASDYPGATLGEKIAGAINALPASGGVVDATEFTGDQQIVRSVNVGSPTKAIELRLGSATLIGSEVPFVLHNNSKLLGNGSTTITQKDGANLSAVITGTNVEACEIAHLTVDGNRAGNTGHGSGIGLTGAKRCRLHHLIVQNTVGRFYPGIAFFGGDNEYNTIEHNVVQHIGTLADYADGIYIAGPGNKVLFNRIRHATDFGIVAESCSGCVIHGNDLLGVPGGIAVGSGVAGEPTAAANIIDSNVISGGLTTTLGIICVYRLQGLAPVATVIKGNIIRDVEQGHGIFVNRAENVALEGNVMENIGVTYPNYGILITNSKNVVVRGGVIDKTGSFGVGIGGSSNVQVSNLLITDAARSGNDAAGIGLDVMGGSSSSVSLVNLHVFDTNPDVAAKLMPFCIDFRQGGTTVGVLMGANLFDDGVNAVGCREGSIRTDGASRISTY